MQPTRIRKNLISAATVAVLSLPYAFLLATLIGLVAWGIGEAEKGLWAFGIAWCATMVSTQIAVRNILKRWPDE
jgi:Kef-type K+ transport system membrane component KefB